MQTNFQTLTYKYIAMYVVLTGEEPSPDKLTTRKNEYVLVRDVIRTKLYSLGYTLRAIGETEGYLANKKPVDHSTIVHSVHKIKTRLHNKMKEKIDEIS